MSSKRKVAPYGTWTSPITSETTSGSAVELDQLHVNQQTGQIYLVEARPTEKGRCAIAEVKRSGESVDILPQKYDVGGKVHGYGGGGAILSPDGKFFFTDAHSDGVFLLSATGEVEEILAGDAKTRYADFDVSSVEADWILAVREQDQVDGKVENTLVVINSETKSAMAVVSGADFYSHPRFSPDGKHVSWMQWDNPDMPWTGSKVYVAEWKDGEVSNKRYVAGKAKTESVCQPRWHFDGSLFFEDEATGFWQLYRYDVGTGKVEYMHLKGYENVDVGAREIHLGNSTYAPLSKDKLVIAFMRDAANGILLYNIPTKQVVELDLGLVEVAFCGIRRVSDTQFAVIGGTTTSAQALYLVDINKPNEKILLKSSAQIDISPALFSETKQISFPRAHGTNKGTTSHGLYIPPNNPDFEAPPGTKPPLIVSIHGGPSSNVPPSLTLESQYFTSRGYAYCHVNHAGSMGYGRAYRDDLISYWGIRDVEDTISCIDYLVSQGLVDRAKVGIRGGSAGGYTVLQSMITYPSVFAAGCSLYGVSDLKLLAQDTHKFEAHYLFALIFPEGATEEDKERVYYERSPAFHADKIKRPLKLLQGDKDTVVPLKQASDMEAAMRRNGVEVEMVVFEGEGHGWKMQEHMKRSIEEEEALWRANLL